MKGIVKAAAVIVLGLAVVAAPASAQAKKKAAAPAKASSSSSMKVTWNAGVGVSLASTTGLSTGFNARFGANFTPSGWPVWIRPEVAFDHFGFTGGGAGVNMIGVQGDAGYDFKSSGSLKPYVMAGIGIIHAGYTGNASAIPGTTNFAVNFGGGIRVPVGSMTGYAELRYNSVSTTGTSTNSFPLTVGLMF